MLEISRDFISNYFFQLSNSWKFRNPEKKVCGGWGRGPSGALRPAAAAGRKKVAGPTYIDPRWSVPPVHDVPWTLV